MAWIPDQQLEQNVARIIVRAREEAARDAARLTGEKNADFAHRGVLNSGFAIAAVEDIASNSFAQWVPRALADVLAQLRQVYGEVPAEGIPWIRGHFLEIIENFPRAAAAGFAEKRSRAGIGGGDRLVETFERVAIQGARGPRR